jgi:hypothetical protein
MMPRIVEGSRLWENFGMVSLGSGARTSPRPGRRGGAVVALLVAGLVLSGCAAPTNGFVETLPAPDPGIETPPAPDPEPSAEGVDDVVFESTQECLVGNWVVNNDTYAVYFSGNQEELSEVSVEGLATFTVDEEKYRMFFDDWEIRYTDASKKRVEVRNGSETVDYDLVAIDTIIVVEREDEIDRGLFSLDAEDGDPVALASDEVGYLPLDEAVLRCSATTLDVVTEFGTFSFGRL